MISLRVLLADDHAIVRSGLRALIEARTTMEVVGEAANGIEAVELAAKLEPDVVIVDESMPLLNGVEVTRKILRDRPETRVIAFTVRSTEAYVRSFYEAGATAFVLKTSH